MEAQRLADQVRRSYEGGAWHGPSLGELLEGVTAEEAARRPLPAAHSIWELVHHVEAWEREPLLTLQGKTYESHSGDRDWPPVAATTAESWQGALERLRSTSLALVAAIGEIDDDKLEEVVAGREFTYYVLLHGVVQHNLYHAGQIALLKRQL
jgi:uncharacterized damage-inducible protein DinB